jgi:invasion protein IalB
MSRKSQFRTVGLALVAITFGLPSAVGAQEPKKAAATPKQAQRAVATTGQGAEQPSLLGQFGEWGAYTAAPGGRKVCFALAKPKSSQTVPPGRKRDQPYFFISTRPSENVKHEVSVIFGYPLKPGADATAEIGPASFAMQTQNDGGWIKNVAEEPRLIEALRKGAEVVVKGESSRGTKTTDQFSLKGLSQALDRVDKECQ